MDEQTAANDVGDPVSIESERELLLLLQNSRLPRSGHWMYRRCGEFTRLYLPSSLDRLYDDGKLVDQGDGTWELTADAKATADAKTAAESEADGGEKVSAPQWEDDLARYLAGKGVRLFRHRRECGYTLALAMTSFGAKLNVEIDGRQHRLLASQRAKDLARDTRLKANGWEVLRLAVEDVVADVEGCGEKVFAHWNEIK